MLTDTQKIDLLEAVHDLKQSLAKFRAIKPGVEGEVKPIRAHLFELEAYLDLSVEHGENLITFLT